YEDHGLRNATLTVEMPNGPETVPMLNALNEVMRESYLKDCDIGVKRWNRMIERAGHAFRLTLPSSRFRRSIGPWAGVSVDPTGKQIDRHEYERRLDDWIPSERDRAFVHTLMQKVIEPGKMAGWIAPPERGINNLA